MEELSAISAKLRGKRLRIGDYCAMLSLVFILVAFAAVIGYWFSYTITWRILGQGMNTSYFCCPDYVRRLSHLIDSKADPCTDFHKYVCSNPTRLHNRFRPPLRDYVWSLLERGTGASTPIGDLLTRYYQACDTVVRYPSVLMAQMAEALLSELSVPASKITASIINRVIIFTNIRYYFSNVITAATPTTNARIYTNVVVVMALLDTCPECLHDTVAKLNSFFDTNIDLTQLLGFYHSELQSLQFSLYTRVYDRASALKAFTRRFDEDDRRNDEAEINEWFAEVSAINLPIDEGLEKLVDVFAGAQDLHVSLYYVIITAAHAASLRVEPNVFKRKHTWKGDTLNMCFDHMIASFPNFVELFYTQKFTSPERDKCIIDLYGQVRNAITDEVGSRHIFRGENYTKIKQVLDNLKLLLPTEYTLSILSPPNVTRHLGYNFLVALNYEKRVRTEKRMLTYPERISEHYFEPMLTGNFLRISPSYYDILDISNRMNLLLNMATVGIRMAQSIWAYLLRADVWQASTKRNIEKFYECFQRAYFDHRPMWPERKATSEIAVALPSVQNIMMNKLKVDWTTLLKVAHNWKLSYAQFFYILFADHFCTNTGELVSPEETVNVPLRHVIQMGIVFKCVYNAPMTRRDKSCKT